MGNLRHISPLTPFASYRQAKPRANNDGVVNAVRIKFAVFYLYAIHLNTKIKLPPLPALMYFNK